MKGTKLRPKGPSADLIQAVVEMKRRNPTWGCPQIAEQINLAFGTSINKDVVRRILALRYQPTSTEGGPSWLTCIGHRAFPPDPRLDWIYQRIAELDEANRSLALLMLDGFSYHDMSQILPLSESNVGMKINRITNGWSAIYAIAAGASFGMFALGVGALWVSRGREPERNFGHTLDEEVRRSLALVDY